MKTLTATSLLLIVIVYLVAGPSGRVDADQSPDSERPVEPYFYVVAADPQLLWKQAEYLILTRSFSYDALVHLAHETMEVHDVNFASGFRNTVIYLYKCALEYDGKTPKRLTA